MDLQEVILSIAGLLSAYYFKELVDSVKQLNVQVARILERMEVHSHEINKLRDDVESIKENIK